ncbi:MAG: LytTR family DNA-binding domain-containing protein [Agriterribacter sp.]
MIKCVVVDDEPLAISLLNGYIKQHEALEMLDGFTDAIEAISFINNNEVHVLFLDVLMPDITGIELLKKLERKPVIIFTTAHRDFAVDGYEMGVVDYLLKPFDFERFKKGVDKAIESLRLKEQDNADLVPGVFVKSEYKLVKINFQDIVFVESRDDYIKIYMVEEKSLIVLMRLKSFLAKLPASDFQQVHRRYIIALNKIMTLSAKKIVLNNSVEIPVGDTYQHIVNALKEKY